MCVSRYLIVNYSIKNIFFHINKYLIYESRCLHHFSTLNLRNIGISAHIDCGKTTLTERILFYTGKIKQIHEVRGSDGVGAKMDSMELERERGITIQSAATFCNWKLNNDLNEYNINIIDTPGHVDFTVEVERALKVLDGGIMLLCAVSGVQSQTLTVDRQMKRYEIPRLIFINKLDRDGADYIRAIDSVDKRLGINAVLLQIPIGLESKFNGIIDLITEEAYTFTGRWGEVVNKIPIPDYLIELMKENRNNLIAKLADLDDEIANLYLENNEIPIEMLYKVIRRCTIDRSISPVLMGSAKGNIGVQLLLDAVCRYLPSPLDVSINAYDEDGSEIEIKCNDKLPFIGYVFKVLESVANMGQLTFIRIYQGQLRQGMSLLINDGMGKKQSVKKLYKMHSNEVINEECANCGDIIATSGLICNTGITLTDGRVKCTFSSMHIPELVVSLSIKTMNFQDLTKFSKAINRFQKEDPTFRVHTDPESKETIISGMGELHLSIYIERMRREYGIDVKTGPPQVNYRETITKRVEYNYTHKIQSGGAGQYAKIIGYFEPIEDDPNDCMNVEFKSLLIGNDIPSNYVPAIQKGFIECSKKGLLCEKPLVNTRFVVTDGASHEVDSSEYAFKQAAIGAFKNFYLKGDPVILEPIMNVEVMVPMEFQTLTISLLTRKKGVITNTITSGEIIIIHANVALKNMFGFITDLRSVTQGQGEFSMEFYQYQTVQ